MYEETIRSFLTRPYPIANGLWSADDAAGSLLVSQNAVGSYFSASTRIFDKLTGFQFLRGGMKFTLRINGTRFHYGALLLAFYPLQSYIGIAGARRDNVISATMMPSIMVNPHQDEIAELEIPFVYPYNYLDLTQDFVQDLGEIRVYCFIPLRAVNATTVGTVSYTLYAHFVDPVVTGFTSLANNPEPAVLVEQTLVGEKANRVVPEAINLFNTDENDTAVSAGVHAYPMCNPSSKELGFSPSDMEFNTIFTRANPVLITDWTSDLLPGQEILAVDVTPAMPLVAPIAGSPYAIRPHYLSTLSRLFRFWRGALRYRLQIVASAFHSGRLMITWNPSRHGATIDIVDAISRRSNTNHIIVDLQQTTEVMFEVPYLHNLPWQTLPNTDAEAPSSDARTGSLGVTVLNRLTTPNGEPSSVRFILWMYGSDSLRFAVPLTQPTLPNLVTPTTLVEQCLVAPLGDSRYGSISSARNVQDDACMGETINNVYDLCRKMAVFYESATVAASAGAATSLYSRPTDQIAQRTHIEVMKRMYLCSRGPVRYAGTILAATNVNYYSGFQLSALTTPSVITSLPLHAPAFGSLLVTPTSGCPNSAIVVPYYSPMLFYINNAAVASPHNVDVFPVYLVITQRLNPTNLHVNAFYSVAPGFQFGYLIAPLS
jgi:hypothetical protein